jgi:aspartate racemase
MREKVIGVLGGMGPEATLYLFEKIIQSTPVSKDQDHLRVIIDSNPKIPDRTEAILERGEDPVPLMVQSGESLARAGADFIVIPCVSAHVFLEELRGKLSLPILSAFDEIAMLITQNHPGIKGVGLLATRGTILAGLFQKRLLDSGINTLSRQMRFAKKAKKH